MRKSKSYVMPFVKRVLNKKMSLKDALDKVPWFMQKELLEQVMSKRVKKSVLHFVRTDVFGSDIKKSKEIYLNDIFYSVGE